MEKLIVIATHAEDNAELATLPFVMAVTATASEMEPVMVLQAMGVWLAKKGYAENISVSGFPPLNELLESFMEGKGRLLVCAPCMKKRGLEPDDLIDGAIVVNAPTVIKEIGEAKQVVSY